MEIYNLITVQTQPKDFSFIKTTTLAIEGSVATWLKEYKNNVDQIILLNSIKITKEEYEQWEDEEQSVHLFL